MKTDMSQPKFDHADFTANPKKYEMFRTARIAHHIFTHNGEADLSEGNIVSIEYFATVRNQLFRRSEPVYVVRDGNGLHSHTLYASALGDFIL